MKFGEYLISESIATEQDVCRALDAQRYSKEKIGRVLVGLGAIDESTLDKAIRGYYSRHFIAIEPFQMPAPSALPNTSGFGENERFVLHKTASGGVYALGVDISDSDLRRIEGVMQTDCRPHYVSREYWDLTFGHHCSSVQRVALKVVGPQGDDQSLSNKTAYGSLYRDAVHAARRQKASDIHIKPTADGVEICFRVLGQMSEPWKTLAADHRQAFINEVKRLANLSIAVSGKAQDSRVSYPSLDLDLRVNLIPSLYGEKIVMRLLDLSRSFKMDDLRIQERAKEDFLGALKSKSGVVLISGPTGSGKTTTLYTAVSSLDRKKLNILTVEDPVEYTIPGITQIGINRKLSFANALRAILRQDPDVILVGEVRDEETADLCFKAASTGHLVLSTIHANGSVEVVQRLLGLGVEKHLLASCLRFSAAQRIVRQLCPACSMVAPSEKVPERESDVCRSQFRVVGSGCDRCRDGYVGLLPVLEYMDTSEIQNYAANGFTGVASPKVSLKEAFYAFARHGLVDVTEVHEIG